MEKNRGRTILPILFIAILIILATMVVIDQIKKFFTLPFPVSEKIKEESLKKSTKDQIEPPDVNGFLRIQSDEAELFRVLYYSKFVSTYCVDITGDNVPENIELNIVGEDGCTGVLKVNNVEKKVEFGNTISYFFIVDIDKNDKYKEIVIHSSGPSQDDVFQIYWFDGANIRSVGAISHWPRFIGDGTVIVGDWMEWWRINRKYRLTKKRNLELVPQRYYEVINRYGEKIEVTVLEEIPIYETPGSKQIVKKLSPGEVVTFSLYDSSTNEYQVETKDKIKGWPDSIFWEYITDLPYAD